MSARGHCPPKEHKSNSCTPKANLIRLSPGDKDLPQVLAGNKFKFVTKNQKKKKSELKLKIFVDCEFCEATCRPSGGRKCHPSHLCCVHRINDKSCCHLALASCIVVFVHVLVMSLTPFTHGWGHCRV